MARPIFLSERDRAAFRGRLIMFLLRRCKIQIQIRGYLPFCGMEALHLDDLRTEALVRLVETEVLRFWSDRKRARSNRLARAA